MKISCGTDIIEIERIKNNINDFGDKFIKRIYTANEIKYCESKNIQKFQSYAGRFAAKEAFFKAISLFLDNKYDISWKDIEIINDEHGRPMLRYDKFDFIKIESIDISISHCDLYAIANVTVLYK